MNFEWKKIELSDKELIDTYLKQEQPMNCEFTFANLYLWSRQYPTKFTVTEGTLVFLAERGEEYAVTFPLGRGDQKKALKLLEEGFAEAGKPFRLYLVTEENFARLDEWFPGEYQIEYNRDDADYIYESEKLITLSGKKLHSKRNHINSFKANYNWSYEPMSEENLEDCFQMALKWRVDNCVDESDEKRAEVCVTLNALRLFRELSLVGGVLRIEGHVVAFTIGEPCSDTTFVVHIEKAFAHVNGAYPMINQQFIEHEASQYTYVNREEDTGAEGLRKAKLSYKPVILLQKGVATKVR